MTAIHLKQYPDERPKTRGECGDMPRPCPFLSCKHHLAHSLLQRSTITQDEAHALVEEHGGVSYAARAAGMDWGTFRRVLRTKVDEDGIAEKIANMEHSCALDIADAGEHSAPQVAKITGSTRDTINSIQKHMRNRVALEGEALDWAEQIGDLGNREPFDLHAPSGTVYAPRKTD